MVKRFRYTWNLTHLNQLERAAENYMELIPPRGSRDSLNSSKSSYVASNVTEPLGRIKAVYLWTGCLLFPVGSVCVCVCVFLELCQYLSGVNIKPHSFYSTCQATSPFENGCFFYIHKNHAT